MADIVFKGLSGISTLQSNIGNISPTAGPKQHWSPTMHIRNLIHSSEAQLILNTQKLLDETHYTIPVCSIKYAPVLSHLTRQVTESVLYK